MIAVAGTIPVVKKLSTTDCRTHGRTVVITLLKRLTYVIDGIAMKPKTKLKKPKGPEFFFDCFTIK